MIQALHVFHYVEVDSTNSVLRDMASEGAPEGTVVWADRQTAGRGRSGRAWQSRGDWGLWFSVLLRPGSAIPASYGGMLPVAAGVAVARSLAARPGLAGKVKLKWPNDVLLCGRKVCGVLCEASLLGSVVNWAVIGVGVNVSTPQGGFPEAIAQTATALDQHMAAHDVPDRAGLLSEVAGAVMESYGELVSHGPQPIVAAATELMSSMIGQVVTCTTAYGQLRGRVAGVGTDGTLLLTTDDGARFSVNAGDVHIGTGRFDTGGY